MRKSFFIKLTLFMGLSFVVLFFLVEFNKKEAPEKQNAPARVEMSNPLKDKPPVRVKVSNIAREEIEREKSKPQKRPQRTEENDEETLLFQRIQEREAAIQAQNEACKDNIDSILSDGNYIDPESDYFENAEEIESKLFQVLPMMRNDVALETSYMIEDFLQGRDSAQPEKLLDLFSDFQQACLESKAITFLQSAIESCKEQCPERLRRSLITLVYDGLPLLLHDSAGAERILLSLTLLESAHRFGLYQSDMDGVNDLRFRVQRNFELMREEMDQARENPGRQSQSIRDFMEENRYLAREVGELLKASAQSY